MDHLIFISTIIIVLSSILGHGLIFCRLISPKLLSLNYGYIGLIGFFSLANLSILSSFFFKHGYIHNILIHIIGIIALLFFLKEDSLAQSQNLKKTLVLFLILIIGIYVFKNHDDFPYYHLTYSLTLSENKYLFGLGRLGHGFRTHSSLFYFHSILYLPYIKYFLFHSGPFFIFLFFNFICIDQIIKFLKKKNINFLFYLYFLSFAFVTIFFYRVGEHGTDRSSQIILLLIFINFIIFNYFEKNHLKLNDIANLVLILILLAASMKALYYIYLIFLPFILLKKNFFRKYIGLDKIYILTYFLIVFLLNISINFFNTGCLIYPETKLCFDNFSWSINKQEVSQMKVHYEWWSKSGGGPNYSHELTKDEYIKNFNWVPNWIDRHFFNKVSDTLFGVLFMCAIFIMLFFSRKKRRTAHKFFLIYLFILIFLLEWFLKHPAMRYGGYILIAFPIILLSSTILAKFSKPFNKVKILSVFLIILILGIYNVRNFLRIAKEISVYKYPVLSKPYFRVKKTENKIVYEDKNITIYNPGNNMCWANKTPCFRGNEVRIERFFNTNIIKYVK